MIDIKRSENIDIYIEGNEVSQENTNSKHEFVSITAAKIDRLKTQKKRTSTLQHSRIWWSLIHSSSYRILVNAVESAKYSWNTTTESWETAQKMHVQFVQYVIVIVQY